MRLNIRATVVVAVSMIALGTGVALAHKVRVRQMSHNALNAGRTAYDRQNWNEAARQFKTYLLKHPDHVEILRLYVRAHLAVQPASLDNLRSAIGAYQRILRNVPADAEATIKLARVQYKVGNYSEAAYVLKRRLAAVPDDTLAALWLARTYVTQHQLGDAREMLVELAQRRPPVTKAFGLLAAIEIEESKTDAKDRAWRWLDSAVDANELSAEALVQRARFRRVAQSDSQGARADAQAAEALCSADPGVQLLLADEWLAHDELDMAAQAISKISAVDPATLEEHDLDRDEFLLRRYLAEGQLTLKKGDAQRGAEVSRQALSALTGPNRATFVPMAVHLALEANNVAEARRVINEYGEAIAREEGISSPLTKKLIIAEAAIAEAEDRPYAVINRLGNFVTSEPAIAEAWKLLARAYRQTDQPHRARHAFEQQLHLSPNNEDALFELARLWRRDDPSRARLYASQLCDLSPHRFDARILQIMLKLDLAERVNADPEALAEVANEIEAASSTAPDNVQLACQKARLLILQEDNHAAQEILAEAAKLDSGLPAAVKLISLQQQAGDLDVAVELCERTAQRWQKIAATRILHAELLAQTKQVAKARSVLEQAVNDLQADEKLIAQVARAQFNLDHEQREQAIADLKQLAQIHASNIKLRLGLLRLPEIQRDQTERIQIIEQIRSIEGEQGLNWRFEQAIAFLQQGDWQTHRRDIESNLEYCIAVDSQWPGPVLALGQMYERLGEVQRAKQVYRKSFELEFAGTAIALQFLDLLISQREFNEAADILARFPADLSALESYRIDVSIGLGRANDAIERLEQRLANSPEDTNARILLAKLIYEEYHDVSEAIWLLEQGAERSVPQVAAIVSILHAENCGEEALDRLVWFETQAPGPAKLNLRELKAKLLESMGRPREALDAYRSLAEEYPSLATANSLAECLIRQNDPAEAVTLLESALIGHESDFTLRRSLAQALLKLETPADHSRGLAIIDELLVQTPADTELLLTKASALAGRSGSNRAMADSLESEKTLRQVLSIQPWNREALGQLAWLIGVEGDRTREALEMTNRALTLEPNDPTLLRCRATILTRLKRTEAARADLLRCIHQKNISGITLFHALLQLSQLESTERHCSAAKSLLEEAMEIEGVDLASREGSCAAIEQLLTECQEGEHGADVSRLNGVNGATMVGATHAVAP